MIKKNSKSSNKFKTTRDIIKELSGKQHSQADIQELMIDSKQDTADPFNNYFSSIIDKT